VSAAPAPAPVHPPRWLGPLLITCIAAVYIVGFVTNASAPKLLKDNPTLLMALNPRYRYMVVAAPEVDPVAFFLIGLGRLLLSDPVYFALGWFYGDRAIRYFNDALGEQTVSQTRAMFMRAAPVMALFFAGPVICVLAGAARMAPRRYFALNVVGTSMIVVALRAFSSVLEGPIQSFLRFNDRNYRWLMILTVATSVFILARVGRRQLRAAKSLADDIDEA
jgi:membrane protein DedA with SNARE-associated domain